MKQACTVFIALFLLASPGRAQKVSTDREHAGLKGQVQKVVTETADLSSVDGNVVEGKRGLSEIETYDAAGNLLQQKEYQKGRLFETRVYSFLDGDRVEKAEINPNSGVNMGAGGFGPGPSAKAKGDSRYDFKTRYEHDKQGRRTKTQRISNQGKLLMWIVMKYDASGNRIEEILHRGDGTRYMKITSTYDAQGNVVESSYDLEDKRFDYKAGYAYEFDAQGNWTRRVRSKWVTKDGKSSFVPQGVNYRRITYF